MINYVLLDNVLGKETSQKLYQFALQHHKNFSPTLGLSRVRGIGEFQNKRKSFRLKNIKLAPVKKLLLDNPAVQYELTHANESLGLPKYDIKKIDFQITSHNDGEYYRAHTDSDYLEKSTRNRIVTYVYYLNRQPKQFSGGELVLYDQGSSLEIEPINDRLVLFESRIKHEVKTVACKSKCFEDGRFTVNGWLHRQTIQQNSQFDSLMWGLYKNQKR